MIWRVVDEQEETEATETYRSVFSVLSCSVLAGLRTCRQRSLLGEDAVQLPMGFEYSLFRLADVEERKAHHVWVVCAGDIIGCTIRVKFPHYAIVS